MERLSRADMQIKIRTPIGLLLVLSFICKWLLDTFEEGRLILENLPPVLGFLARPLPSIILLCVGIGLILWELHSIRKVSGEPEKRQLRHYLIGSGISFVGLVIIVIFVVGVGVLLSRHQQVKAETPKPIPVAKSSSSPTSSPASETEANTSAPKEDSARPSTAKKDHSKAIPKVPKSADSSIAKPPDASTSSQTPRMSQECAPGASCGMSSGQQGGLTAGTVNIGAIDRHVTPTQASALTEFAQSAPKGILSFLTTEDAEAETYADEIGAIFFKAGIGVGRIQAGRDWSPHTPTGIVVSVKAKDAPAYPLAEKFAKVMTDAGMPAVAICLRPEMRSDTFVLVTIGNKTDQKPVCAITAEIVLR